MKRLSLLSIFTFAISICLIDAANAQPTVSADNGVLGFFLNSYGRIRAGLAPYSTAARQIDGMSFVAALSQNDVYDIAEDSDSTNVVAQGQIIPGVDTAFVCITDNQFSNEPPKIRVRHTLFAWKNTNYVIVRFRAINDSFTTLSLYLGVAIVPRAGGRFGGETISYDTGKKTAYFFRAGENPHWGIRLLNKDTYSVKIRDWDNYSPNPVSDVATDSTRYDMTATPGFDSPLIAGANGSIYHVNAGLHTIAPGDSAEVFYAIAFGNSLPEMLTASDAAQDRYDSFVSGVDKRRVSSPKIFALQQNYPNPFNPLTNIRFELLQRSDVQLTIYDAAGREVKTLLNKTMGPGSHTIPLNASRMTSGIYFCTLRTERFSETRKMLLIR